MGAYELWQRTKKHLANAEQGQLREVAVYYQAVLDELQPSALLEYLETRSLGFDSDRLDWTDPEDHATTQYVRDFLAGLDEIRGTPKPGEPVKICGATTGKGAGMLTCDRVADHDGPHGDSRVDNGWYEPPQICGAKALHSADFCSLPKGHNLHRDAQGVRWER